jgi:rubrerythrin
MVDVIKFIEEAIEKEEADKEKYHKMAEEAEDPEARMVFAQLARDEENHARVLRERLTAIRMMKSL